MGTGIENFSDGRRKLATVWLCFAALLLVLMIARTVGGAFTIDDSGTGTSQAWSWFLPTIMPTLSLILGSLMLPVEANRQVPTFNYRVAFWISTFYLTLVVFSLLLLPGSDAEDPLKYLTMSNLWLAPLQGIVATSLGWFFVKTAEETNRE